MALTDEQKARIKEKEKRRKQKLTKFRADEKQKRVGKQIRDWLKANGWVVRDVYTLTKGKPAEYKAFIKNKNLTLYHKLKMDDGRKRWITLRVIPLTKINGDVLKQMTERGKIQPTGEVLLEFLKKTLYEKDELISKFYFGMKILDLADKLGYNVDEVLMKSILSRDMELIKKLLDGE